MVDSVAAALIDACKKKKKKTYVGLLAVDSFDSPNFIPTSTTVIIQRLMAKRGKSSELMKCLL